MGLKSSISTVNGVLVKETVVEPPVMRLGHGDLVDSGKVAEFNAATAKKSYAVRDFDAEARGKCLFGYLVAAINSPAGAAFNMDADKWWNWCVKTAHESMKISFPDYKP